MDNDKDRDVPLEELLQTACSVEEPSTEFQRELLGRTLERIRGGKAGLITTKGDFGRNRNWSRVGMGLSACLAGLVFVSVWWLYRPQYVAEAVVLVAMDRPYLIFPKASDERRERERVAAMPSNRIVVREAAESSELIRKLAAAGGAEPASWLREQMSVRWIGESDYFSIGCQAYDRQQSVELSNHLADTFVKLQRAADTYQFIVPVLAESEKRWRGIVEERRDTIRNLSKQATQFDPFNPFNYPHLSPQGTGVPIKQLRLQKKAESDLQKMVNSYAALELEIVLSNAKLTADERGKANDGQHELSALALTTHVQLLSEERRQAIVGRRDEARAKRDELVRLLEKKLGEVRDMSPGLIEVEMARVHLMAADKVVEALADWSVRLSMELARPQQVQVFMPAKIPELKSSPVYVALLAGLTVLLLGFALTRVRCRPRPAGARGGFQFSMGTVFLLAWAVALLLSWRAARF